MKLLDLPVFFLDLQTTGGNAAEASLLEIAFGYSGEFQCHLIQQPENRPVPYRIQLLTGISEEEMSKAIPLSIAIEQLSRFLSTTQRYAVIHFAQFEKPFLAKVYENSGGQIPFPILCTHQIAKRLFPGLPARGIRGIAGYFGHRIETCKRALEHVTATEFIWKNLVRELSLQSIDSEKDLLDWLKAPAKKRGKYIYPFQKEKRLVLPHKPGIYRMKNALGEILYVGKATSLRSRVNSYFRGQKNRHPRTMELLTQVWDIEVTACETPLEAAVMETDEIKKWNPPYNVVLKTGDRTLVFFSRDLTRYAREQTDDFPIGPFSSPLVFDSILKLSHCLMASPEDVELVEELFFEPIDPELLKEGYIHFCALNNFSSHRFADMRAILAQGLFWVRRGLSDEKPEEPEETRDLITAEKLSQRFQRHFIRSAKIYRRAKRLTRLLNCRVQFDREKVTGRILFLRNGQIVPESSPQPAAAKLNWDGLSIETYDRISVLLSELSKSENVVITR